MEWIYTGIGILIGWATKIPIFLKMYKKYEKERDETRAMIDRINENKP